MRRRPNTRELTGRAREAIGFNRTLLANAGSMVGTSLVTSVLGLAFWIVAAHYFDQGSVGVASAATSAMILLGFTGTIGMGTLLMGELPQRDAGRWALVNAALIVAVLAGAILGLCFAVIAPLVSSNLAPLDETVPAVLFFAGGVGLTSLGFVLDQALIGMLHGGLQLTRNVVFSFVKLAVLIAIALLVAYAGAPWIYSSWAVGVACSLVVLVRFYRWRGPEAMQPDFALLGGMRGSVASHAAVNMALETADLAMPILVVVLLSPQANAGFYMAWMIAGFLVMVPLSLSMVLYAIGSGSAGRIGERFRFTFGVSMAFGAVANLVLLPGAGPLLQLFGSSYANQATTTLHIMALGVFPLTFKTHYVSIHRMQRRLRAALPIVWAGTFLELGGGAVGAVLGGLQGVAWGWLAGLLIEAAAMAPDVIRGLRAEESEFAGVEPEPESALVSRLEAVPAERI
jgi:O-antigen/teichoic acid export membrane protein